MLIFCLRLTKKSEHRMPNEKKKIKVKAIKKMIEDFCEANLHEMYQKYVLHLCDVVSRKRKLNIARGKNEIFCDFP